MTFLTRERDHDTSIAASKKVMPKISMLMGRVLSEISMAGVLGLTDSELRLRMITAGFPNGPESTYRKRRSELFARGYVIWSGDFRTNERGSKEKVWIVRPLQTGPLFRTAT